jgi:hypothetical protein
MTKSVPLLPHETHRDPSWEKKEKTEVQIEIGTETTTEAQIEIGTEAEVREEAKAINARSRVRVT